MPSGRPFQVAYAVSVMRWLSPFLFLLVLSCAAKGPGPDEAAVGTPPGETGMHEAAVEAPPGETAAPRGKVAAPQAGGCWQNALTQLKALDPDGYSIYEQIDDKQFFRSWITCKDLQLDLSTAVHESTHHVTAQHDAFPLVNGGEIGRPHQVSKFYAPSLIAAKFAPSDFVHMYLTPGEASSATDFLYLLDELNAYSHDLNAAVDLESLHPRDAEVDHRDGLAALMAFVAVYVETAKESEPVTWSGLQQPAVAKTVATLWRHAEQVMGSSCRIPNIGDEDKTYIRRFCEAGARAAMQTILGRPPVCPVDCLRTPRTASRD
jgi:hypothetical protein